MVLQFGMFRHDIPDFWTISESKEEGRELETNE